MPTIEQLLPADGTLTPKEARFFRYLMEGAQPTQAALLAFNTATRAIASVRASQTLRKFNIRISDIMDNMGMTDEWITKKVKGLCNAKRTQFFAHEGVVIDHKTTNDNATQAKGVELACRLKRHLDDSINVEVNQQFNVVAMMRGALEREEKKLKESKKD